MSFQDTSKFNAGFADDRPWIDCWQCGGTGALAGCFEDTCCGADCDPEDSEYCCAPSRCDVCKGKGGWDDAPEQSEVRP